jgi:hypothetical protein
MRPHTRNILRTVDKLYASASVFLVLVVAFVAFNRTVGRASQQQSRHARAEETTKAAKAKASSYKSVHESNIDLSKWTDEELAQVVQREKTKHPSTTDDLQPPPTNWEGTDPEPSRKPAFVYSKPFQAVKISDLNPDDVEYCLDSDGNPLKTNNTCRTLKDFPEGDTTRAYIALCLITSGCIGALVILRLWIKWLFGHFFDEAQQTDA